MTTKSELQKIFKGLLHTEEEITVTQENSRKNKPLTKHTSKQVIGAK
jgi:hypothetical protein